MHQKKMESILNRLSKIIDHTSETLSENISKSWRSFGGDEIKFYLHGEHLDAYNKLLKELLDKEKWGEKFLEKYVDKVLQNSMFTL
jgi:hypothetical protein